MNAAMPDKQHVGSFVTTTIGLSNVNDNPFRIVGTRANAANRRQSVAGRRIGRSRRRASHSPGRPMEPETIRAQEQIAIM